MYKPIVVLGEISEKMTVAFVDSGADETIIGQKLADQIGVEAYGVYHSYSASGDLMEGRFGKVTIKDHDFHLTMEVGITDIPFNSDYSDEEGVDVILGVDFLQDAKAIPDFA